MPLDFWQINNDGVAIGTCVSMNIPAHIAFTRAARALQLATILRVQEYYDDLVFEVAELRDLSRELELVMLYMTEHKHHSVVVSLHKLTADCIAKSLRIEVIAD